MSVPFFAMDTCFYTSLGAYEFDARCEMLAELGYEGTYLTVWSEAAWKDVPKLGAVKKRFGLDVVATYFTLELTPEGPVNLDEATRLLESLEGCPRFELAIRYAEGGPGVSDKTGDDAAVRALEHLLPIAERRDITVALYPHWLFWMERLEDAVRLCQRINHPRLRAVFCGFHWAVVDGVLDGDRLAAAGPWLSHANVCGIGPGTNSGLPKSILPLDKGDIDNFAVLGALRTAGLPADAWIGLQGYSVGGDVYANLRRSRDAFVDLQNRLTKHPHWAKMREL